MPEAVRPDRPDRVINQIATILTKAFLVDHWVAQKPVTVIEEAINLSILYFILLFFMPQDKFVSIVSISTALALPMPLM